METEQVWASVPLLAAGGYALLLVVAYARRNRRAHQAGWLQLLLAVSIIWCFARFWPFEPWVYFIQLAATTLLAVVTAAHAGRSQFNNWLLWGVAAVGITGLLWFLLPAGTTLPVQAGWPPLSVRRLSVVVAWLALNSLMLLFSWREFRRTYFPLHANRLLFWNLTLSFTILGDGLVLWPQIAAQRAISPDVAVIVSTIGESLRWFGTLALTYAVSSYRLFDVRTTFLRWVGVAVQAVVSALPVILAIYVVEFWEGPWSEGTVFAVLALVAIAFSFLFYQPLRGWVERLINRYLLGEKVDAGQVVRRYTQAIAPTLDVELLSQTLFDTLGSLMPINRGALVLVSRVEDGYDLEPIPAVGQIHRFTYHFSTSTLFLNALARRHQPLLQYEMDFAPDFAELSAEERQWLAEMAVDVYVPISDGSRLVGIVAVGPKHTGVPYQSAELELMQILADQTVVALQNARLYRALGEQNEKIRQLNTSLVHQNERLEIMDRVKTDFITIASHELRTPLAQVKGYTDILATLNDDRALTFRQLREIVGQVNRATSHLESVISAMLDASQLDVAGVQLNVITTTMEAVLNLAIEPLAEAMRERRIRYLQEGIIELPPITADLRRLAQAFGNVIGNAIKYTPDYGQIVVTGALVPGQSGQPFVEITVADSGIGIDPQFHELIFEKFFRIGNIQFHSTGNTKFRGAGPGLGLPIARGIIAAHDGRIWVDSEGEDEERLPGSRFTIILPLKQHTENGHVATKEGYNGL